MYEIVELSSEVHTLFSGAIFTQRTMWAFLNLHLLNQLLYETQASLTSMLLLLTVFHYCLDLCDKVSCSPGLPQTFNVTKGDLELLILPPWCCDYWCVPPFMKLFSASTCIFNFLRQQSILTGRILKGNICQSTYNKAT